MQYNEYGMCISQYSPLSGDKTSVLFVAQFLLFISTGNETESASPSLVMLELFTLSGITWLCSIQKENNTKCCSMHSLKMFAKYQMKRNNNHIMDSWTSIKLYNSISFLAQFLTLPEGQMTDSVGSTVKHRVVNFAQVFSYKSIKAAFALERLGSDICQD